MFTKNKKQTLGITYTKLAVIVKNFINKYTNKGLKLKFLQNQKIEDISLHSEENFALRTVWKAKNKLCMTHSPYCVVSIQAPDCTSQGHNVMGIPNNYL